MKVYQQAIDNSLNDLLNNELSNYRNKRKFNCDEYLEAKTKVLVSYVKKHDIKNIIISLSGGVDSALVAAMLKYVSINTKVFDVHAITSPASNYVVTNQSRSLEYSKKQASALNIPLKIVDLSDVSSLLDESLCDGSSLWAKGQLVPYMRTPLNYYYSTLLNDTIGRTIICGTTNRDEGAYLGYVGKASDYIVDIQLISDLHKSEVYTLAKYLGVIDEIINVEPDGDMYDGRTDVQVFGASYDFVELYLNYLNSSNEYRAYLDTDETFMLFKNNIETLHSYNAHKYLIGSPAVHMDVMNSGVNNGWNLDFEYAYYKKLNDTGDIHKSCFVNPLPFNYYKDVNFDIKQSDVVVKKYDNDIRVIDGLIDSDFIDNLFDIFNKHDVVYGAGIDGYSDVSDIMSNRKSLYSVKLSEVLFNNVYNYITKIKIANRAITDWNENEVYRCVGINPLFRYIEYLKHGKLIPHYDYSFSDGEFKSLYSVVIYMSDNTDGETSFMVDENINVWNKDLADKSNFEYTEYLKIKPKKGRIVIFPHHLLHCGLEANDKKVLLRSDLMFKKLTW